MQNSRLTTPSRWNLWKSLKFPALHAELFQKTIRQNKDLGIRAHLELEPILELEPPSNLAKRISARALIPVNTVMKKFTNSEEHFDIKIEIVSADTKIGFENWSGDFGISTADSEVPKDTNRFW